MVVLCENFKYLVEDSRPTLYRALKYWGKKPHNIWRELICANTDVGDIVFDPFAGSAMTFFEAIKAGRKPVISDINPLTLFLVEVYSKEYDFKKIISRYHEIEKALNSKEFYLKNYKTNCSNCGAVVDIYNYRNQKNCSFAYSYKCEHCKNIITDTNIKNEYFVKTDFWKPSKQIDNYSSVCEASLKAFGGYDISNIWSNRNLEILACIFDLIKSSDEDIRNALMFAFLQTLHLTTKMCALRSEKTNRPLSTSWGRPAFMYLSKSMEQNPLIQFKRALFEKNGVIKALESRKSYLPTYTYSTNIKDLDKVDGIVCIKDSKQMKNFRADFIITDPPYGSIIQYGELSSLWNIWLENFDDKYKINLDDEIIVKKDCNYFKYMQDMDKVFSNCFDILADNGKMILTFNSNNEKDWECINSIINNSRFDFRMKYCQKNKRSSEANVNIVSDLGNSDYYFVLEKSKIANANKDKELLAI